MKKQKHNRTLLYSIYVTLICLCIGLAGSVTYARYRSDFLATSFWLAPAMSESVYLHGWVEEGDAEAIQSGIWTAAPSAWSYVGEGAQMPYSLSNGSSGTQFSSRDQQVTIAAAVSLTAENPEKLQLIMEVWQKDGTVLNYTGIPEQLQPGSRYYEKYGPGWIYRFRDEQGRELQIPLEGGCLDYVNCRISAIGMVEASLVSLELQAAFTELE